MKIRQAAFSRCCGVPRHHCAAECWLRCRGCPKRCVRVHPTVPDRPGRKPNRASQGSRGLAKPLHAAPARPDRTPARSRQELSGVRAGAVGAGPRRRGANQDCLRNEGGGRGTQPILARCDRAQSRGPRSIPRSAPCAAVGCGRVRNRAAGQRDRTERGRVRRGVRQHWHAGRSAHLRRRGRCAITSQQGRTRPRGRLLQQQPHEPAGTRGPLLGSVHTVASRRSECAAEPRTGLPAGAARHHV